MGPTDKAEAEDLPGPHSCLKLPSPVKSGSSCGCVEKPLSYLAETLSGSIRGRHQVACVGWEGVNLEIALEECLESNLSALKLVLDGVGLRSDVSTLDARKAVQKTVYLCQRAGVDLGYRFGWYLLGPYSADLASDYYALDIEQKANDNFRTEGTLTPAAALTLASLRDKLEPARPPELMQPEWLELLASVDFLLNVAKLVDTEAREIVQREKGQLYPHFATAVSALEHLELLGSSSR